MEGNRSKMKQQEYKIRLYTPGLMPQVVDVLEYLWGNDLKVNQAYFQWKYLENPYTDRPLGVVALHQGKVVGFRGYFATRYEIPGKKNDLIVLCPGDTCVHPEHRRKGLSVRMGDLAMQEFAEISPIFLNTTATHNSLPGYQKMGFFPLVNKAYLSQYTLTGFIKYILTYNKLSEAIESRIRFGTFDHIQVSEHPKPEAMAGITGQNHHDKTISVFQDDAFFRWRFRNPRKIYLFYYYQNDEETSGYVVIGLSPNKRRGYILDYAGDNETALEALLRFMIRQRHFDILSIYNFGVHDVFLQMLRNLSFKTHGLLRQIEKRKMGELPLLIRPVKKEYTENDWFLEDVDMRTIKNWRFKEIGSDAV